MAKKKTTSKKPVKKTTTTKKKKSAVKKTTKASVVQKPTTKKTTTKKKVTKTTVSKTTSKSAVKKSTPKKTVFKKTTEKKTTKKSTPQKTAPKKKTTSKKTTKAKPKEKTPEEIQEEKDRIESYTKAGKISKKVKEFIKPKIKSGVKLLELVELAEKKIVELGGKPGFPVNLSVNHVAAHYTPTPGDTTEVREGDVVKFDHGVHIDGYSVDTAFTVSLNTDPALKNLVKASEEAVKNAIKKIKHGVKTNALGAIIEETVRKYGYKPVINLQGHKIERWDLHGGKSIPCISLPTGDVMEEGEIFAVEVFVSTGEGQIHAQQSNAQIFQLMPTTRKIPIRVKSSRKILGYISREFRTLPFSRYQIFQEFGLKGAFGLRELLKTNVLEKHNILSERKGFFIAQTEHTILVTKTGCKILT